MTTTTFSKTCVASDRTFLGEGLFETVRVCDDLIYYPKQHFERMKRSARVLHIPFDWDYDRWYHEIVNELQKQDTSVSGIKIVLTSTHAPRGLASSALEAAVLLSCFQCDSWPSALTVASAMWRRDKYNPVYMHKTINYLESVTATRLASKQGADEVVFFDMANHLLESTVGNCFILKGNRLLTPCLPGPLSGITRARILALAPQHGLDVLETQITQEDMAQSDSLFIVNALRGITSVACWENKWFVTDNPDISLLQDILHDDAIRFGVSR